MKQIQRLVGLGAGEALAVHCLPAHDFGNFVQDDGIEIVLAGSDAVGVVVIKKISRPLPN